MELAQIIARFGPLSPARVVALCRAICLSLAEAHEAGLIHRDLKPENIFVCRLGMQYDFPKVLDFGVAKVLSTPPDKSISQQQKTSVLGTPGYIAPEVMLGGGAPVDHRFDIYSLGCVAYLALTGREVFPAKTDMQRMVCHATKAPTPPSVYAPHPLPAGLDALLLDCLAKQPDARISSAMVLYQRLGQLDIAAPWTIEEARRWWETHAPDSVKAHATELGPAQSSEALDAMFSP